MGVLLDIEEDADVFNTALNEAKFIVTNAKEDTLDVKENRPRRATSKFNETEVQKRKSTLNNKRVDSSILGNVVREVKGIIKEVNTELKSTSKNKTGTEKVRAKTKTNGHCIRCDKSIAFKINAPYCRSCFKIWDKHKNKDYKEKYCHMCGKPNESISLNKPLCYSCYSEAHT